MKKYFSFRTSRTAHLIPALMIGSLIALEAFAEPRDSVSRDFRIYDNGDKPDLAVDPKRFESQMSVVDRYFAPDSCALVEEVVGDSGYRRLLRFDVVVLNMGDGDLFVGDRADPNNPYADYFHFNECHGHYHINGFSYYQLLDLDGNEVIRSTKQGFCFEDSFKYAKQHTSNGYHCEYQGITSGWGDWYYKQLGGQWIDITGVPEGDYIVRVTINPPVDDDGDLDENGAPIFNEGANEHPNVVETIIHVPDPRKKVAVEE
jgi:hypothetical protein